MVALPVIVTMDTSSCDHRSIYILISGHCGQNFCDQKCIDIDNGGFACDCYHGYQLNRNGFTCSSKYIKNWFLKKNCLNVALPTWSLSLLVHGVLVACCIGPVKQNIWAQNCNYFLSQQYKHLFWVLKRTFSLSYRMGKHIDVGKHAYCFRFVPSIILGVVSDYSKNEDDIRTDNIHH